MARGVAEGTWDNNNKGCGCEPPTIGVMKGCPPHQMARNRWLMLTFSIETLDGLIPITKPAFTCSSPHGEYDQPPVKGLTI